VFFNLLNIELRHVLYVFSKRCYKMLHLNIVVTCPEKECCCLGLHSIWLNHKFAYLYIYIVWNSKEPSVFRGSIHIFVFVPGSGRM